MAITAQELLTTLQKIPEADRYEMEVQVSTPEREDWSLAAANVYEDDANGRIFLIEVDGDDG